MDSTKSPTVCLPRTQPLDHCRGSREGATFTVKSMAAMVSGILKEAIRGASLSPGYYVLVYRKIAFSSKATRVRMRLHPGEYETSLLLFLQCEAH